MSSTKKNPSAPATPPTVSASSDPARSLASTVNVTFETLEATPGKVLPFLRAVGTTEAIRTALITVGYTDAVHERGWALLHLASGYKAATAGAAPETDRRVIDAVATLDAWDEKGFRISQAALKHNHPDQFAYVFEGLTASKGPSAVLGVKTFLDRLDELESGKERKATRADDAAALATLAARGIHAEKRAELRALVEQATVFGSTSADASHHEAKQEAQLGHLRALRAWYEEWSDIARASITRKDYLIKLGLANRADRKSKKKKGSVAGDGSV